MKWRNFCLIFLQRLYVYPAAHADVPHNWRYSGLLRIPGTQPRGRSTAVHRGIEMAEKYYVKMSVCLPVCVRVHVFSAGYGID